MSDDGQEDGTSRVVGVDEMFTVYRSERAAPAPDPTQGAGSGSFREVLVIRMLAIDAELSAAGWPPLFDRVAVGDSNSWGALPPEWSAALEADGHPPEKEVPGQFELGMNFIIRRAKPLTAEYWLVQAGSAIRRCLDATEPDDALWAASDFGQLVQSSHLHVRHLPAVRRKAKQLGPFKAKAKENPGNAKRREEASIRHAEVLNVASKTRDRNPRLSDSEIAARTPAC